MHVASSGKSLVPWHVSSSPSHCAEDRKRGNVVVCVAYTAISTLQNVTRVYMNGTALVALESAHDSEVQDLRALIEILEST